jgi:hypothetical protein
MFATRIDFPDGFRRGILPILILLLFILLPQDRGLVVVRLRGPILARHVTIMTM